MKPACELAESCVERLDLDTADRDTVRYLVANHLEMSAAVRRDVFDPANVKSFAERVGAPERLKMLCLMTYADIKAVNPEAMTPWKADNLWQLYIASANYLNRSADERVHTSAADAAGAGANLAHLHSLAAGRWKKGQYFSRRPAAALPAHSRRQRRSRAYGDGLAPRPGRRRNAALSRCATGMN